MKRVSGFFALAVSACVVFAVVFAGCDNPTRGNNVPVHHTVTFNANGGAFASVTTYAVQVQGGQNVAKPQNNPTRGGFTFEGWYADVAFTIPFNFSATPITAPTTIFARWAEIEALPGFHLVIFNTGYGSYIAAVQVQYGQNASKPPVDPTRGGFTFEGWYADAAFTIPFNFAATPITAPTTIFARWAPVYHTITFNANGGVFAGEATIYSIKVKVQEGQTVPFSTEPMREGHTFIYWFNEATDEKWDFNTIITVNIILRARWIINQFKMEWNVVSDTTFGSSAIIGIAYGGGKFVAVGPNGRMAWSIDGKVWNYISAVTSTFGTGNQIRNIAYGGGKFVAVGQNGRMAWALPNDIDSTWNAISAEASTFGYTWIFGVDYGGGRFVAVGQHGRMAWALPDKVGYTWNAISASASTFGSRFIARSTYGGGKFVAGGQNNGMAWALTDNLDDTWNAISLAQHNISGTINGIVYGGGRFVAVGDSGNVAWALPDNVGDTWNNISRETSTFVYSQITGIAYGSGRFVAVGNAQIAWAESASKNSTWGHTFVYSWIHDIAYGNGTFVAVGENGWMAVGTFQ